MEETTTTTVDKAIDMSNFENFWAMLSSSDKDNAVVALTILNNADFNESLPYVLLLFKDKDAATRKEWKAIATDLWRKLDGLGIQPETNLSYKKIFEVVHDRCSKEAVNFVLGKFAPVMQGFLVKWGMDFMDKTVMTVKLKEDDNTTDKSE